MSNARNESRPRFNLEATTTEGLVVRYHGHPAIRVRARRVTPSGADLARMFEALKFDPASLSDLDLATLAQLTEHDDWLLHRCETVWCYGALEASLSAVDGSVAACDVERVARSRESRWSLLATQRGQASLEPDAPRFEIAPHHDCERESDGPQDPAGAARSRTPANRENRVQTAHATTNRP